MTVFNNAAKHMSKTNMPIPAYPRSAFSAWHMHMTAKRQRLITQWLSTTLIIKPYPKRWWLLIPLARGGARTDNTTRTYITASARRGQFPRTLIGIVHGDILAKKIFNSSLQSNKGLQTWA